MYGSSTAATPEEYINGLEEPRRTDVMALHDLIRTATPELLPTMEFGMPGYGKYHYRYASGREGDWVLVGLASNKNYISLYVTATVGDGTSYLAETFRSRLPKASIGKSCVRFRHVSDVDTVALAELLRAAADNPPGVLETAPGG